MASRIHLLIGDSDEPQELATRLRGEGHRVECSLRIPDAIDGSMDDLPDLLIVRCSGRPHQAIEACVLGSRLSPAPGLLVLHDSTRTGEAALLLDLGADACLPLGIRPAELLPHVRCVLRRRRQQAPQEQPDSLLEIGPLRIELARRSVRLDGTELHLTPREFDIIVLLARHPQRVFTRDEMLDRIWGAEFGGYSHTVNAHVQRLRAKLQPGAGCQEFIETVWGTGYRLANRWMDGLGTRRPG